MKIFRNLGVIVAMALALASNAFAADSKPSLSKGDPLSAVDGYDGMGGTQVAFSKVSGDASYTVTLSRLEGVAFKGDTGGLSPVAGPLNDKPTSRPVWIYKIPDGSTVYAFRLGANWGTMSEELEQLDLSKDSTGAARPQGVIEGGKVTIRFEKRAKPCEMISWVVALPNNAGRMWGAHPSEVSKWVVPNVNGSPRTGWCTKGTQVVDVDQHDPQIRVALKAKK